MPEGAPLALCAGRLHEAKGLVELVAAWRQVAVRRPDARLWLAGEGPYRKALATQIGDRGLEGRVFLVGVFDSVDGLLAAADLFISSSPEEGPSLALLEAMAAGLPTVAADTSGNREIVTNERDGLLVPAEDSGALGAAISRLWDNPELAARLGAAARDRVEARFSLARMGDAHLKLFETLILSSPKQDDR
jgi:glycosyltransferase involved in cell wall biosynthesis